MPANKFQARERNLEGGSLSQWGVAGTSLPDMLAPLFGCNFSFGSWDSQTLRARESCGFALFYFEVGEGVKGGDRERAGL